MIEDYYATIYSAEIVNTLTNLLFIWLCIKGSRNCLKYDHDSVFLVAFLGYGAVGTGELAVRSWHEVKLTWLKVHSCSIQPWSVSCIYPMKVFSHWHDAASDPMQLVDELSMIYTTCLMCYATFSFSQSRIFRQVLAFSLIFLSVFITVSMLSFVLIFFNPSC